MKVFITILAVLFMLGGAVWFLQGINLLPGSFMTGQIQWAVYGGFVFAFGVVLLLLAYRKKPPSEDEE